MIQSISHHHNPLTLLIPIKASSLFPLLLLFLLIPSFSISCPNSSNSVTMKVHPIPKKRTLTDNYNSNTIQKKLRRLPHTFNRVLELPLRSDANVLIEDGFDSLRFVVAVPETLDGEDVRAHAVEIHPGVVKIVVKGSDFSGGGDGLLLLDELRLDRWRYRLPATIRADKATAVCVDGELIVTVPKNVDVQKENDDGDSDGGDGDDENWGVNGIGRLVLVQ